MNASRPGPSRREFLKAAACAPAALALSCARTSLKDEHAHAAPLVVDGHLHCFAGPRDPRFPYHARAPYRPDAAATPDAVEQVAAAGAARSVILIPGGLGEVAGTESAAARIRAAIDRGRASGQPTPILTGPNSMGIRSVPGGYDATFIPPERMTSAITPPLWGSRRGGAPSVGGTGTESRRGSAPAVGGAADSARDFPLAVVAQSGAFTL